MNFYSGALIGTFIGGMIFGTSSYEPEKKEETKFKTVTVKPLEVNSDYVAYIESRYDSQAVSPVGAMGYMQIMPDVLKDWNKAHPTDRHTKKELFLKDVSLKIGTWYLNEQIPMFLKHADIPNKVSYCLIAYNWGIGNFIKWHRNGEKFDKLPLETRQYLLSYWKNY